MTTAKLVRLLTENKISLDTTIVSNSGWECGPTDMEGVFYNPYANCIEITQGFIGDLQDHVDWVCLSLAENEELYTDIMCTAEPMEYRIDPETRVIEKRPIEMIPWADFATRLAEIYDTTMYYNSDEDDNVVYCPECGEPIYEDDYPKIGLTKDNEYICPICETRLSRD